MIPSSMPRRAVVLVVALLLAGCGDDPAPVAAPAAAPPPRLTDAEALAPEVSRLLAEGNEAFAASQFVTPPGASALERYISALQLDPANVGAKEAIVEVFPLGVAAAEKAIASGERLEAARIIALLQRASPDSLPVRALQDRMAGREPSAAEPEAPAP
jgi:protein TonB